MKKMYYGIYDGEAEAYRLDGSENYMITISSMARTPEEALWSITGETGGNCFGPSDADEFEWLADFLAENFRNFEDMTPEEEQDRIEHLAEEWGLEPDELEYLR